VQPILRKSVALGETNMNLVPTRTQGPADDLDGLLRAFYRKEMPKPWPAPPGPPGRLLPAQPSPRGFASFRSHLALAASLALILLGSLLAGGKPRSNPDHTPGFHLGAPEATRPPRPHQEVSPEKLKSSLSLEQDPEGGTAIKVEIFEEVPPPK
jgi:hypothetical protein